MSQKVRRKSPYPKSSKKERVLTMSNLINGKEIFVSSDMVSLIRTAHNLFEGLDEELNKTEDDDSNNEGNQDFEDESDDQHEEPEAITLDEFLENEKYVTAVLLDSEIEKVTQKHTVLIARGKILKGSMYVGDRINVGNLQYSACKATVKEIKINDIPVESATIGDEACIIIEDVKELNMHVLESCRTLHKLDRESQATSSMFESMSEDYSYLRASLRLTAIGATTVRKEVFPDEEFDDDEHEVDDEDNFEFNDEDFTNDDTDYLLGNSTYRFAPANTNFTLEISNAHTLSEREMIIDGIVKKGYTGVGDEKAIIEPDDTVYVLNFSRVSGFVKDVACITEAVVTKIEAMAHTPLPMQRHDRIKVHLRTSEKINIGSFGGVVVTPADFHDVFVGENGYIEINYRRQMIEQNKGILREINSTKEGCKCPDCIHFVPNDAEGTNQGEYCRATMSDIVIGDCENFEKRNIYVEIDPALIKKCFECVFYDENAYGRCRIQNMCICEEGCNFFADESQTERASLSFGRGEREITVITREDEE